MLWLSGLYAASVTGPGVGHDLGEDRLARLIGMLHTLAVPLATP